MTRTERQQREARQGWALIVACVLIFAAMVIGAAHVDASRGVSVDHSLRSAAL